MPKGNPGVKKTAAHNAAVSAALRGKSKSAAHRAALSSPKSDAHKEALRRAVTPEVVAQRRATSLERHGFSSAKENPEQNPNRVEYWIKLGMSESDARESISRAQKTRVSLRKNAASQWQISYWLRQGLTNEQAKARVTEIQTRNAAKSSMTVSKECSVFLDAIELASGLKIEREVILSERFKVDGYIPPINAVIEYFGSFWHMHPDDYEPDDVHRVNGWKASSKWAEDLGRVKYLKKSGYLVFVVWDRDATEETVNMIAKEIKDAR